jgi:hypothetical protein
VRKCHCRAGNEAEGRGNKGRKKSKRHSGFSLAYHLAWDWCSAPAKQKKRQAWNKQYCRASVKRRACGSNKNYVDRLGSGHCHFSFLDSRIAVCSHRSVPIAKLTPNKKAQKFTFLGQIFSHAGEPNLRQRKSGPG